MTLTRPQLASLCCQGSQNCLVGAYPSSPFATTSGMPLFLSQATTASSQYIGVYGNSDPLDISQWVTLDYLSPTTRRLWQVGRKLVVPFIFFNLNLWN